MIRYLAVPAVVLIVLAGCTSTSNLPARADDVDFTLRGKAKDRLWHDGAIVNVASEESLVGASETAVKIHGLRVKSSDPVARTIIASKGFTMTTWNVVVGIYYKQVNPTTFEVHVASQNDKDLNNVIDDSQDPFPPKIVASIKNELDMQASKR